MKRMSIVSLWLVLLAGTGLAQGASVGDRAAIEMIVGNWNRAWQTKDARMAAQDYSDNADWTNAFGMTRKGRTEIEKFLTEVFSIPSVMAGKGKIVDQSIKLIRPDVALVVTRVERTGQRTPSGEELDTRRTTHLRVLVKTDRWQIVSHLISDARDPQRREH